MRPFELIEKPHVFFDTFDRRADGTTSTHYCPGCGHGIVHKLLAGAIDELGIQDRTILVAPIGCAVFIYYYFEISALSAAHGRAPAAATAISRAHTDAVTISYQGDGDLAAIGTSQILHAANRGENMIVLFINNANYGMTGGQLAPTSLVGQKTVTSPFGRTEENDGSPIAMAELIAGLKAPVLVARSAVASPKTVLQTRNLIRRGLEAQVEKKGFVFLEILSPCPTNWHVNPVEACRWIESEMVPVFPLGIFKDETGFRSPRIRTLCRPTFAESLQQLELCDVKPGASRTSDAESFPLRKIKIAGFGGQGILSLGERLARLGMARGLCVTHLPSYGPEMRGGIASCSVILAPERIASPLVERPDLLVAMNRPSLERLGTTVTEGGMIFYNRSMIDEVPDGLSVRMIPVAASDLAVEAGNIKTANSVMLGAVVRTLRLCSLERLLDLSASFGKESFRPVNNAALRLGWNSVDVPS